MKITLEQAYKLLQDCSAVIADDNALMYPSIWDLDDEEFLFLHWDDDDGYEYYYTFLPKDNQEVEVHGCSMWLIEEHGEEVQLTLLTPMLLETPPYDWQLEN